MSTRTASSRRTFADLRGCRRILVVGSGGAGKSTLAIDLGRRLGLPVVHLDRLFWKPGWVEPTREEFLGALEAALATPRWIMDGNFSSTLPQRLAHADAVVFLDYTRWVCLRRVLERIGRSYGRVRADMAPGCPEHFDPAFLHWVWSFPKRSRQAVVSAVNDAGSDTAVFIFRSPRELATELARI